MFVTEIRLRHKMIVSEIGLRHEIIINEFRLRHDCHAIQAETKDESRVDKTSCAQLNTLFRSI